jgi:hypothetical protein
MKGKGYAVMGDPFPISQRFQLDVAQAGLEDGGACGRGKIPAMAGSRMIRVRMCDHRALDGLPGIDMELPRHAIQPLFPGNYQIRHGRREDSSQRRTGRAWLMRED